jgi:hypothetical protein
MVIYVEFIDITNLRAKHEIFTFPIYIYYKMFPNGIWNQMEQI